MHPCCVGHRLFSACRRNAGYHYDHYRFTCRSHPQPKSVARDHSKSPATVVIDHPPLGHDERWISPPSEQDPQHCQPTTKLPSG